MVGTLRKPPALSRRKVGTTSSHHGPYVLGYTRATMVVTMGQTKKHLISDCRLQLAGMKLESLVIVGQHTTVNTFPGLVHTARHTMGVVSARSS